MAEPTYYRGRREDGGLRLDVARRLRRADGLARLAQLFVERGPPPFRGSANGPACTATAVRDWLHRVGGTTRFIEPGSPWENGSGESFNGTRRDACRKRERFDTLLEAPIPHRGLAAGVQPDPPPPCPRLPPPRPGNAATPGTAPAARPGDRTHLTTGPTIEGRSPSPDAVRAPPARDRGRLTLTAKAGESHWSRLIAT